MKMRFILGVLLVLTASEAGATTFSTVQEGFAAAEKQKKPVLLHFYGTSCPACAVLDRNVLKNQAVIDELAKNWVVVKINCTSDKKECVPAVTKYDVHAWPTWVFLDRNLKEVPGTRIVKWEFKSAQVLSILQKARASRS